MFSGNHVISIDQKICQYFEKLWQGTNAEGLGIIILAFLSLLVATICAFIIGFEREYHGHAAGLRTHMLVSLGSALVMIVSIYGFGSWDKEIIGEIDNLSRDPARLAAQVVSGIGFLGAGTIIQTGSDVKGLTTATTLWLVMAIGLAAGSGNFIICIIATALSFFALVGLRKIEKLACRRNPLVTIVVKDDAPVLKNLLLIANRFGINIRDVDSQIIKFANEDALRIVLRCSHNPKNNVTAFVDEIREKVSPLEIRVSTEV